MALNKNEKDNFKTALFYLKGGFKDKPEISENKQTESWEGKPPIPILDEDDKGLLRDLSEKTFDLVKRDYPQLWQKIKEAFRADKIKEFVRE